MTCTAYVWRDKIDPNQFWIGTEVSYPKKGYAGWIPVFIDALGDCFGRETAAWANQIEPGSDPFPVTLQLIPHNI